MSSHDWSVVGFWSHPVPGDPATVASAAQALTRTADRISEAATGLRGLDSSATKSLAVDELVTNAHKIAGQLEEALERYRAAGTALSAYAPVLERAQRQAEEALQAAGAARAARDQANGNARELGFRALASMDPEEKTQLAEAHRQAKARAEDASSSFEQARARILAAMEERDSAADRAADTIDDAISGQDLNDGFMDRLKAAWDSGVSLIKDVLDHPVISAIVDAVITVGKWILDNLDTIAMVLTALALIAAFVPGLQPLAPLLAGAARVAGAAAKYYGFIKSGIAVAKSLRDGDLRGALRVGAGALAGHLVSKKIGNVVKGRVNSAMDRAGKRALDGLVSASDQQTGGYRTALNAMWSGQRTPVYHPAHSVALDHLGRSRVAEQADAVLSTFKGGDYTRQVAALGNIVQVAENSVVRTAVETAVGDPIKDVAKRGVDGVLDGVLGPAPETGTHKVVGQEVAQPVGAGSGSGGQGGGGW